jgi:hypothetical protein
VVSCQSKNNFEATAMANGTGDTLAYQTERAHRDLDASIEAGRAACQAAILINGGAAIALLAYVAGKVGQPGALVRAACIAFGCYAIGVFQGALSMWFAARAGALFGWAGLETLSLTERNQIKEQERQGWEERRARAEWFEVLFDPRAREAWRKAWFKVLFDRRARPAWFKALFDRSMLLGGHLEDAWGHLSLHAQAFYASIILFLVATIWMAVWMYIALG